jgi:hypothetical protein
MSDEDLGPELPQRMRGTARGSSVSSVAPVLSEELRRRLQAAVKAERGEAEPRRGENPGESPADEFPAGHAEAKGSASGVSGVNGVNEVSRTAGHRKRAAKAEPPTAPVKAPKPPASAGVRPARSRRPSARLLALALAVLVIGSAAVLAIRHLLGAAGNSASTSAAWLQQEPALRDQAAAWVSQQVSPSAKVACDQAMCTALSQAGFPAGQLVVIGPTSSDLTSSDIAVATPVIRAMFGTSISTAYAPAVLASFGSGTAEIDVRVLAPNGVGTYQSRLGQDLNERKQDDATLVGVNGIELSPGAREQLNAGQVDLRLVFAIAAVASTYSVDVVDFGNVGTGGSPGMPLRYADIAENIPAGQLRAMRAALAGLKSDIRPARTQDVTLAGGQTVLRVEFTAPSPSGVFSQESP